MYDGNTQTGEGPPIAFVLKKGYIWKKNDIWAHSKSDTSLPTKHALNTRLVTGPTPRTTYLIRTQCPGILIRLCSIHMAIYTIARQTCVQNLSRHRSCTTIQGKLWVVEITRIQVKHAKTLLEYSFLTQTIALSNWFLYFLPIIKGIEATFLTFLPFIIVCF